MSNSRTRAPSGHAYQGSFGPIQMETWCLSTCAMQSLPLLLQIVALAAAAGAFSVTIQGPACPRNILPDNPGGPL